MTTFLAYGIANVAVGFALLFNPNVLYQGSIAYLVHERTGFVSSPSFPAHSPKKLTRLDSTCPTSEPPLGSTTLSHA